MSVQLNHAYNQQIDYIYHGSKLFSYVYAPETPQIESPRPYFHPLSTLQGSVVTIFRPTDHLWHQGLSLTCAVLSGENFWGGVTYVRDKGYVQLPNNGSQSHLAWDAIDFNNNLPRMTQTLHWLTQNGKRLLEEKRQISVETVNEKESYWVLRFSTNLLNISGKVLDFGSPTTEGRENAGYGGLFWRGPRSFCGGKVMLDNGLEGEEAIMGQRGRYLSYTGRHDETSDFSTLIFLDSPANPRHPTQWFARNGYAPMACCAFMFDEILALADGDSLKLDYKICIADGELSAEIVKNIATACRF
jgi:hypothetical protein